MADHLHFHLQHSAVEGMEPEHLQQEPVQPEQHQKPLEEQLHQSLPDQSDGHQMHGCC